MPVYNGEKYLAEAIESIIKQTFSDFEFLIVDDGSQDGSAKIIREYEGRDGRVRLIQLDTNSGQANAQNRGFAEARGEYIALMDCDDVSLPERLRKKVDFLQGNPEIGLVGSCIQSVDRDLQPIAAKDMSLCHAQIVLNYLLFNQYIPGAVIMMRREVFETVGPYANWPVSNEDSEFFARAISKTRFAILPERLYQYRHHEDNKSFSNRQANIDESQVIRCLWFHRIGVDVSPASLDRIGLLRFGVKYSWLERRKLRRDLARLTDVLIASNCVDAVDRPLLEAEFARLLENATPRLWQMFLHWRRHRFGSGKGGLV